ncbi:hypothetical protein EZS27_026911 [termite gut metagenome]|uniref:Uncharacterized protein n=1 Tax=termite gut metagenome TaxID=433724 RepID=A0A5J4QRB3_9ZZZZ
MKTPKELYMLAMLGVAPTFHFQFSTFHLLTTIINLLKTCFLRYAKQFCPIYVRSFSDSCPIPARFPSGQGTPKKPVETVADGG